MRLYFYIQEFKSCGRGWLVPSPCGASRCHQNLYFADGKKGSFVCLDICPSLCLTSLCQVSAKTSKKQHWQIFLFSWEDVSKVSPVDVKRKRISISNSWKKNQKGRNYESLKDWEKTHYCIFEVAENIDIHVFWSPELGILCVFPLFRCTVHASPYCCH